MNSEIPLEHCPDISQVYMVEDTIKKFPGLTFNELYKKLPEKLSKEKYKTAIIYFLEMKYANVDNEKRITWSNVDLKFGDRE